MRHSPRPLLLPAVLLVGLLVAFSGCFLDDEENYYAGPLPKDTTIAVGGSVVYRAIIGCPGGCGGPVAYEWKKDGVVLTDRETVSGTVISGATTDSLRLTNVHLADSGTYSVTIGDSLYHGTAHLAVTPIVF